MILETEHENLLTNTKNNDHEANSILEEEFNEAVDSIGSSTIDNPQNIGKVKYIGRMVQREN